LGIEERVTKLENKIALLTSIADSDRHPFICACLDADLDVEQVDRILALITKVENTNIAGTPVSYSKFEADLKAIVPSKVNDAEFAKTIIKALNKENKFIIIAKKFKAQGTKI
jgi:chitinase